MNTLFWIWLAVAGTFLILEVTTPAFLFACFAVGGAAGAVTVLFTDAILTQLIVFAAVSLILIPLSRPLARRITKEPPQLSNVDAMVGRIGIVTRAIDPDQDVGQVRVDGQVWQAVAQGKIDKDDKVKVDQVIGARLHVTRIES